MDNKDESVATEKAELFELDGGDGTAELPLGRADWIGAALGLLIEEGIDAVRITRLAEALDVTREHVGVLLFRARRRLRAAFEEAGS